VIWESDNARLALLELLSRGSLKRRRTQLDAYDALAELPWTRATGRRDEIGVVEEHRTELAGLLDRVWPAWRDVLADLVAAGLPPTPDGYGRLLDMERAAAIPELPERINRRTAVSLTASHSKASLTEARRGALGGTDTSHDGSIRLRPPAGLSARTANGVVDLSGIATVLGEVSIPERALLDGLAFEGGIRAVLLVENLGAWRDLSPPPGWLLAHVPGWDTATVGHLLDCIEGIPVVHFGDIDPNGVRIMLHLRRRAPNLKWFLPEFWFELADACGLPLTWPKDFDLDFAPAQVRELAARGLWLEQERIVLDPRIADALEAVLAAETPG
jgi:Wadjet protein JetD, C-terminal